MLLRDGIIKHYSLLNPPTSVRPKNVKNLYAYRILRPFASLPQLDLVPGELELVLGVELALYLFRPGVE